jgi:hypothetical protein
MWIFFALTLLVLPVIGHAETKIITAEGTYTMGDGETPSFAEAMALQKAKQTALEEAGTYVQSYTKVQNLNLTTEEIQTITGGLLQVEVLQKTRTLVGDGLRLSTKIRATVTTDKMEELAGRVKGKEVATEYKKLQQTYAGLAKDIDRLKQMLADAPQGPARDLVLNELQEREAAFAQTQRTEEALFQRLVSGELLVQQAQDNVALVEALVQKIQQKGHIITIGEPRTKFPSPSSQEDLEVRIPIKVQVNRTILPAIEETAQLLGGSVCTTEYQRISPQGPSHQVRGSVIRISKDDDLAVYFGGKIAALRFSLHMQLDNGSVWSCRIQKGYSDLYMEERPIAPVWSLLTQGKDDLQYKHVMDLEADHWKGGGFLGSQPPVRWTATNQFLLVGERDAFATDLAGGPLFENYHHKRVRMDRYLPDRLMWELNPKQFEKSDEEWEKLEREAWEEDRESSLMHTKMLIPKDLMPSRQESPSVVVFEDLRTFTFKMSFIDPDLLKRVVAVRGDYQLQEQERSSPEARGSYLEKREKMVARMKNIPKGSPAPQWKDDLCGLEK